MITEMSRGHICLKIRNRTIKVQGEALLPIEGHPNYVIYSDSIKKWDVPFESEEIDEKTRNEIIEIIKIEFKKRNSNERGRDMNSLTNGKMSFKEIEKNFF